MYTQHIPVSKHFLLPPNMLASPSTLLIPQSLCLSLQKKIKLHGSLQRLFHSLILKYSPSPNLYSAFNTCNVKRRYQKKGLSLRSINFRPHNADWLWLTETARGLNVSRCSLFVYLLQLDCAQGSQTRTTSVVGTPHEKKTPRRQRLLKFVSFCRDHGHRYTRELLLWR